MVDELRNQLKSQDLSNLLASSVSNVGGSVFPDEPAAVDIEVFTSIIEAWQKVHVPSYGTPIAGSFVVASVDGSETILTPSTNQVARVQAIACENTGGAAPIIVNLVLGSTVIASNIRVDPLSITELSSQVPALFPIYLDKSLPLSISVTSGTAADLTTEGIYSLTSQ
tara:strand:+ start:409 stop:912 length:504 start_codon:yes stop_codon:yes gene_type:complete